MAAQTPWDISVEELKRLRDERADFTLLDVREPREYEICHLGGELIPLGTLANRLDDLDRHARIVVHCRSGGRSANAVKAMRAAGFTNVWNLNGGILAWIERIDPSLTKY
jgi:rhodanese-related sulfurtransferase